ncbi:MAG: methyltransferase domain-containing protein [Phycisphaeraceae bacterium]|nr:methyltransferase domain-containing protein [Phycisphaeraceae bacterium]
MLGFVRQALRDLHHTGSVWPSSRQLAKEMTKSIRALPSPRRILEVGPGTGPFTRALLKELRDGDRLDLVELSEAFCRDLDKKLIAPFRRRSPGVKVQIHCAPIESVELDGLYQMIVCGLPFNNFPPKLVRAIFKRLMAMLEPGGELVYFEYAGVRVLKGTVASPEVRGSLKRIGAVGRGLRRRHEGRRKLVLGNLPPAFSVRLQKKKSGR